MYPRIARYTLQLLCVALLAGGALARAEDRPAAPSDTFELSFGAGYGQGLGPVARGVPTLQDMGKAGGTFELDFGWRFDPHWEAGLYGEFGYFGSGNLPGSDHALSGAAGLQGQYHVLPAAKYDPWVGLGAGWRGHWGHMRDSDYGLQGLDLVRFRAGLDYRLTPKFSAGPMVGVTLTQFLSAKPNGSDGYADTHDRKVDTFVYAGIGGRFDL